MDELERNISETKQKICNVVKRMATKKEDKNYQTILRKEYLFLSDIWLLLLKEEIKIIEEQQERCKRHIGMIDDIKIEK